MVYYTGCLLGFSTFVSFHQDPQTKTRMTVARVLKRTEAFERMSFVFSPMFDHESYPMRQTMILVKASPLYTFQKLHLS